MTENNTAALSWLRNEVGRALGERLQTLDEKNNVLFATINPPTLQTALQILRDDEQLQFDMLVDIVGVDTLNLQLPERFQTIYVLKSVAKGLRLCVRCCLPGEHPVVPSVSGLFAVADWLEREVYDQFGIHFTGHPNLKRLLNSPSFVGHPLRKDYPVASRQAIPESDTLLDEMKVKLEKSGRTLGATAVTPFEFDPGKPGELNDDQTFLVNLGPSHPIVHGILRLLLALEGETIIAAVPEI
ncbi:MAG: NADH-quinone oxidoreductase subunit C, partial [Chitinivibrionales bacterium]|nr:NADH-quinone oxidoreductase subunit C [Chitinivibrionales bacterium]